MLTLRPLQGHEAQDRGDSGPGRNGRFPRAIFTDREGQPASTKATETNPFSQAARRRPAGPRDGPEKGGGRFEVHLVRDILRSSGPDYLGRCRMEETIRRG